MTAAIIRLDGPEAYDLIFTEHLSMLPTLDQETMRRAMYNSAEVWIGRDDGMILATWGLIAPSLMSDMAYFWLFTTNHLPKRKMMFLRHSREVVQQMFNNYTTLVGHCACEAKQSQRWLRWLGAEFGEPINDVVIPFTIKAKPSWQQDSAQSA